MRLQTNLKAATPFPPAQVTSACIAWCTSGGSWRRRQQQRCQQNQVSRTSSCSVLCYHSPSSSSVANGTLMGCPGKSSAAYTNPQTLRPNHQTPNANPPAQSHQLCRVLHLAPFRHQAQPSILKHAATKRKSNNLQPSTPTHNARAAGLKEGRLNRSMFERLSLYTLTR